MAIFGDIMTDFENYTLVLSAIGILLVVTGLLFTGVQIRQNTRTQREQHRWNLRMSAQAAIAESHEVELKSSLEAKLSFIRNPQRLPLSKIHEVLDNEPELVAILHRILNVYESYARGISQKIYDENVIKDARMHAMISMFNVFQEYVDDRRSLGRPMAWTNYENIIEKWKSEENRIERHKVTIT